MQALKHLGLMIVVAIAFTFIKEIILNSWINTDFFFVLGMAIVAVIPGAAVLLIGLIFRLFNKWNWSSIVKIAWIVLIIINLIAFIGNIGMS